MVMAMSPFAIQASSALALVHYQLPASDGAGGRPKWLADDRTAKLSLLLQHTTTLAASSSTTEMHGGLAGWPGGWSGCLDVCRFCCDGLAC